MAEVTCGNCDHYLYYKEKESNEVALCDFFNRRVSAYDTVCEEFVIMKGFYTKRTIPEYCKHYKKKRP